MIKENKYNQYGVLGLSPKGIIIHNTSSNLSAKELLKWLETDNIGSNACHFLVDDLGVVKVMPVEYKLWTTGKGNDWAFENCIAIEICSNLNEEKYLQAEKRAIALIKKLMKEYNLTTDDIYFHRDFNLRTYCPADILDRYGTKSNFIKENLL